MIRFQPVGCNSNSSAILVALAIALSGASCSSARQAENAQQGADVKADERGLPLPPPDLKDAPPVDLPTDLRTAPDCSALEGKYGVVVKGSSQSAKLNNVTYVISDEKGVEGKYSVDADQTSMATGGWLDAIMIPGRRIRMAFVRCGSGGFATLTEVEALSRTARNR